MMRKIVLFLIIFLLLVALVVWQKEKLNFIWSRFFPDATIVKTPSKPTVKPPTKPLVKPPIKPLIKKLLNKDRTLSELLGKHFDKKKVALHISKSNYKLTLVYNAKKIKEYPIVLGGDPVNDKQREGDKRTPEGKFKIKSLYSHPKWSKFIWINYPTSDSWKKYTAAKTDKKISNSDRIGGQVGIHGVPYGYDKLIDYHINWTLGCISLKSKDINEIFSAVQVGTPIEISH